MLEQNSNVPAVAGLVENPYKQFDGTVPAGGQITFDFDFNFCRVLTAAAGTFRMRFGESGTFTDIVGGGLGLEFPVVLRKVAIQNISGAPASISLGLAIGRVLDDRLNVSGNISVINATGTCLSTKPCETAVWNTGAVTVDGTADLIIAANADRESVSVQAGTLDLYVGGTNGVTTSNGFKIPAGGSHTFTHRLAIYGIRSASSASAYYSEQEF